MDYEQFVKELRLLNDADDSNSSTVKRNDLEKHLAESALEKLSFDFPQLKFDELAALCRVVERLLAPAPAKTVLNRLQKFVDLNALWFERLSSVTLAPNLHALPSTSSPPNSTRQFKNNLDQLHISLLLKTLQSILSANQDQLLTFLWQFSANEKNQNSILNNNHNNDDDEHDDKEIEFEIEEKIAEVQDDDDYVFEPYDDVDDDEDFENDNLAAFLLAQSSNSTNSQKKDEFVSKLNEMTTKEKSEMLDQCLNRFLKFIQYELFNSAAAASSPSSLDQDQSNEFVSSWQSLNTNEQLLQRVYELIQLDNSALVDNKNDWPAWRVNLLSKLVFLLRDRCTAELQSRDVAHWSTLLNFLARTADDETMNGEARQLCRDLAINAAATIAAHECERVRQHTSNGVDKALLRGTFNQLEFFVRSVSTPKQTSDLLQPMRLASLCKIVLFVVAAAIDGSYENQISSSNSENLYNNDDFANILLSTDFIRFYIEFYLKNCLNKNYENVFVLKNAWPRKSLLDAELLLLICAHIPRICKYTLNIPSFIKLVFDGNNELMKKQHPEWQLCWYWLALTMKTNDENNDLLTKLYDLLRSMKQLEDNNVDNDNDDDDENKLQVQIQQQPQQDSIECNSTLQLASCLEWLSAMIAIDREQNRLTRLQSVMKDAQLLAIVDDIRHTSNKSLSLLPSIDNKTPQNNDDDDDSDSEKNEIEDPVKEKEQRRIKAKQNRKRLALRRVINAAKRTRDLLAGSVRKAD